MSQRIFATRQVSITFIGRREAIIALENSLFGREMSPLGYAEIMGAPDDSAIEVQVQDTEYGAILAFEVRQSALGLVVRSTVQEVEGEITLFCHDFHASETAPRGVATRIIARQASQTAARGVAEIMLLAAGGPGQFLVGYYVWPRLGFTVDLRPLQAALDQAGFRNVATTNELFRRDGGAAWWRENGVADFATLDLATKLGFA